MLPISPPGRFASGRLALRFVAGTLLASSLAGCATPDRLSTATAYPEDFRARHPIVMTEAPSSLDIFPSMSGLDKSNTIRVRSFAGDYLTNGQGPIVIQVPANGASRYVARPAVDQIRRTLHASGVKGHVQVGSYLPSDPAQASPIRVSYVGLSARTARPCGEWPRDLASASSLEGWENKAYWNFGCATQANLAMQVADPRDLVSPRGETPSDVAMRTRAITKVRMGEDPAAKWLVRNSTIGTTGGN